MLTPSTPHRRHTRLGLALCAALLCASPASAQRHGSPLPLSSAEGKCIIALTTAGLTVAKQQGKDIALCLAGAQTGQVATAQDCLTADLSGKVALMEAKTTSADATKCTAPPSYGYTGADTVNASAEAAALGLEEDLFAADLDAAVILKTTSKTGAACQLAVAKAAQKLLDTQAKAFGTCQKTAIGAGSVDSTIELAACVSTPLASDAEKIATARAKLTQAVADKCIGVSLASAFPGECASAANTSTCISERSTCRACLMADGMESLSPGCDEIDDGLVNDSCTSSSASVCGDGAVAASEGCDDGDTTADDGCDADCAIEAGYQCSGEPSTCTTTGSCVGVDACGGDERCGFKSGVSGLTVTCYRKSSNANKWWMAVTSTGLPDHAYANPVGSITSHSNSWDIPLEPTVDTSRANKPCPSTAEKFAGNAALFGSFGVAINGVVIFRPLSVDYIDPVSPPSGYTPEMLDYCDAHGGFDGSYHYHFRPPCLYGAYQNGTLVSGVINVGPNHASMSNSYDRGEWARPSTIAGWSLEGFPIYGPYADAAGSAHSGLDACNGKLGGPTGYAYYMSDTFPYMLGCKGPGQAISSMTAADWTCTTNPPAS